VHFDNSLNFLDLFLPRNLSSADRAKAFLWLIFHYLEPPNMQNPFHDDYSRKYPGKVPLIRQLSEAELSKENIDTPEEIEWGSKMSTQRNNFLQKLVTSIENEKKMKNTPPSSQGSFLSFTDSADFLNQSQRWALEDHAIDQPRN
jgi:Ino eighty subunit 1